MIIENRHNYDTTRKYSNQELIEVYKDTLIKATQYPIAITRNWTKPCDNCISMPKNFPNIDERTWANGKVSVVNLDTVSAIQAYSEDHDSVICALNMASNSKPGGGVAYGAKAQEEALFRCSNLGLSISSRWYPMEDVEVYMSEEVVFFKDKNYKDFKEAYEVSVISCPAVKLEDGKKPKNYKQITEEKMKLMLTIPFQHACRRLILGAWGCGVYGNDPNYIAKEFKRLLFKGGYRFLYDEVIFAIINDKNSVGSNYEIFKKHLDPKGNHAMIEYYDID